MFYFTNFSATASASSTSKSSVWKYFNKIDKDKGECQLCNSILSCKKSSTSGMQRHLFNVHNIGDEKKCASGQTSQQNCPRLKQSKCDGEGEPHKANS